jgi:hypothetical protein
MFKPLLLKTLFVVANLTMTTLPATGQKLDLSFALGDRAATLGPFVQLDDNSFHPVLQESLEIALITRSQYSLYQTALVHQEYHQWTGYSMGIRSETGFRQQILRDLYAEFLLGIGYLAIFPTSQQFVLAANGEYGKASPVISAMEIPVTVAIGYRLANGMAPFVKYQYSVQFPYNHSICLLPFESLLIGWRIPFKKK